ncbi:MAG TPA: DinB family protein [Pyrinomonadaceae bacterium]|jgi:hypothetical protein|nr:DinB family protein [Pyrinomonadaceae bacterium]
MKRVLQRLDAVHEKLLSTVSSVDPGVYAQRPADGEWSIAEIVHHLCLVEDRVIKELEGAIARGPRRVGFFRRLIPTSIVSSRLLKVKAPKAVSPLDAPVREHALENFARTRNNLKTLCTTHGPNRLRNLVFKHPFLGEIDGVATVSFVAYHEQRHYKQIREVLTKIRN